MSAIGLHRVIAPAGVLPQAADRLDTDPAIRPDEVRITVERLNLDAASFRQLRELAGGDGAAVRRAVLEIIETRGKMHNPVTGSGGMLIGTVADVGPDSPLGLQPGDRVATRSPGLRPSVDSGPTSSTTPISMPPEPVTGLCILPRVLMISRTRCRTARPSPPASSRSWRKLAASRLSRSTAMRTSSGPTAGSVSRRVAACGRTPFGSSTR